MPIWAKDLEGGEALIMNKNNNTVTFVANVFFVTEGVGRVNPAQLKKAADDLIVNQLDESQRTIGGFRFDFKINFIDTDQEGNSLSFQEAKELAKNSSVTYTKSNGETVIIEGAETGVVIANDDILDTGLSDTKPGQFISNLKEGADVLNKIVLNKDVTSDFDQSKANATFVHELGHFLGRRGIAPTKENRDPNHAGGFQGTNLGVTSREDKNVRLVPRDLPAMFNGARNAGIKKEVDDDE